jgi:hypothetical protein
VNWEGSGMRCRQALGNRESKERDDSDTTSTVNTL